MHATIGESVTTGAGDAAFSRREASPAARRAVAAAVAGTSGGVLGVAAFVSPSSAGLGTHQQLNLPPCGWINLMDMPCMTCGMTTAFSHAVRGSFLQSMLAQPMGFLLALATAMALLISLHTAITGSNLTRLFQPLWTARTMWLLAAVAATSWAFKIVMYKGLLP